MRIVLLVAPLASDVAHDTAPHPLEGLGVTARLATEVEHIWAQAHQLAGFKHLQVKAEPVYEVSAVRRLEGEQVAVLVPERGLEVQVVEAVAQHELVARALHCAEPQPAHGLRHARAFSRCTLK